MFFVHIGKSREERELRQVDEYAYKKSVQRLVIDAGQGSECHVIGTILYTALRYPPVCV